MSNNKAGGITLKNRMIAKYGSYEAYKVHMQLIASIGGKNGTEGGFKSEIVGKDGLTGYERARIAGAKGGRISRRRKML